MDIAAAQLFPQGSITPSPLPHRPRTAALVDADVFKRAVAVLASQSILRHQTRQPFSCSWNFTCPTNNAEQATLYTLTACHSLVVRASQAAAYQDTGAGRVGPFLVAPSVWAQDLVKLSVPKVARATRPVLHEVMEVGMTSM